MLAILEWGQLGMLDGDTLVLSHWNDEENNFVEDFLYTNFSNILFCSLKNVSV